MSKSIDKKFKYVINNEGELTEYILGRAGFDKLKLPGTIDLTVEEAERLKLKGYDVYRLDVHEIFTTQSVNLDSKVKLPDVIPGPPGKPGLEGPPGKDGKDGKDGKPGKDGATIEGAHFFGPDLVFFLDNGDRVTLYNFKYEVMGKNGREIAEIYFHMDDGKFQFIFDDGSEKIVHTTLLSLINGKENKSEKNKPFGYAGLDENGKIPVHLLYDVGTELKIVESITERNNLHPIRVLYVYVKDASQDASVDSGGAFYMYDPSNGQWIKTHDDGSLNVVLDWSKIQNKPETFPTDPNTTVVNWSNIQNRPLKFNPSFHTHPISEVVGLQDALDSLETAIGNATGQGYSVATHTKDGLMSKEDKIKLDEINVEELGSAITNITNNLTAQNIENIEKIPNLESQLGNVQSSIENINSQLSNLTDSLNNKVNRIGDTMTGTLSTGRNLLSSSPDGVTIDWSKRNKWELDLVTLNNRTLVFSPPNDCSSLQLIVKQHNTTPYTIKFPNSVRFTSGSTPDVTQLNGTYIFSFVYIDGKYYAACVGPFLEGGG